MYWCKFFCQCIYSKYVWYVFQERLVLVTKNGTAPVGWCLQLEVTTLQGHSRDVLSISFDPEDTVTVGHGWFEAVADSQRLLFQWEYNSMIIIVCDSVILRPWKLPKADHFKFKYRTIPCGALAMMASSSYGTWILFNKMRLVLKLGGF